MNALDQFHAAERSGIVGVTSRLARALSRVTRRQLLVGTAVAGSALAVDPKGYALRPVTAYATICGPGNLPGDGWTVFCCTITGGANACPPGSFAAGWWKAADSSWCGGGYRYIVDCNAQCTKCSTGCSDGICDNQCWNCSCGSGSTSTCDQRRVCCNAFRYGQCNTHVTCSGGVHCRMVSCRPPYQWAACNSTSLQDNRTSEHSAPCVPQWGPISSHYRDIGDMGSFLKGSTSPVRAVGDNRGSFVTYQGGAIYDSNATYPIALNSAVQAAYNAAGGPRGALGYPKAEQRNVPGGWIAFFERGAIAQRTGGATAAVIAEAYDLWQQLGRETGTLGMPTGNRRGGANGGWVQPFASGFIARGVGLPPRAVHSAMVATWQRLGFEAGVLGYPSGAARSFGAGLGQGFQGGDLWAYSRGPAIMVRGSILTTWKNAGGPEGSYGYPTAEAVTQGGVTTQTFQGGTITV